RSNVPSAIQRSARFGSMPSKPTTTTRERAAGAGGCEQPARISSRPSAAAKRYMRSGRIGAGRLRGTFAAQPTPEHANRPAQDREQREHDADQHGPQRTEHAQARAGADVSAGARAGEKQEQQDQ